MLFELPPRLADRARDYAVLDSYAVEQEIQRLRGNGGEESDRKSRAKKRRLWTRTANRADHTASITSAVLPTSRNQLKDVPWTGTPVTRFEQANNVRIFHILFVLSWHNHIQLATC